MIYKILVAIGMGLLAWLLIESLPRALAFDMQRSDAPITIEADNGLEWDQDKQLYIAKGNALAKQGDSEIHADTLEAYYTETEDGTEIDKMIAVGNVKIVTMNETAVGQKATYDAATGLVRLTGDNVKIIRADSTLSGSLAEVNMNTGVSKLINDNEEGRVRATFSAPQKNKEKDTQATPTEEAQ